MAGIIEVRNLKKVYTTKDAEVEALQDINLSIQAGDIYGIIGMSGAGKSTLVRCLNFLERPTEGTVEIEGKDLSTLTDKELRKQRSQIAMIFQHFNLLMQKNVIDNICFPLVISGMTKKEARKKAEELLEIVGMTEKAKAYPSQLSGGQKQRVAIARALAVNPKILLCDEATSALDPQTTQSILALLKDINKRYGITIVIITHEMAVVREICSHVAIIGNGHLVEQGRVFDIFSHPKTKEAKELIVKGKGEGEVEPNLESNQRELMKGKSCIRIVFSENSSFEPVIANMVLKFGQPVNILKADTKNVEGIARGEMILGLPEEKEVQENMKAYLKERGLAVEEVDGYVD
ncbi:MAG: ATP-binding cassette domain-containing protein [Lachnospiraceae bacterium]|nr:ATP-binding cassette domain-containing protein [Lachnospiraceae bacterium]